MEFQRRLSNCAWVYMPNTLMAERNLVSRYPVTDLADHTLTFNLGLLSK